MNKLLVICGQTATGKTSLAAFIGEKVNKLRIPPVEVISVDSRQIYTGMDIGTGKDRPEGINIWGYDLVSPKDQYSVSQFQKYAREKVEEIWQRGHLPILVGGTGFYIKAVVDGIDTISTPKNEALRTKLKDKNAEELFKILQKESKQKAQSLNSSDKKNPARLIRAIEVLKNANKKKDTKIDADILFIGVKHKRVRMEDAIKRRVTKRLKDGFDKEVDKLLLTGVSWDDQSMKALGYRQWREYKEGRMSQEEATNEWLKQEVRYAKRQLTWFKKDERIHWLWASDPKKLIKVEDLVERWHNNN